jgi:hypothetical protein
MQAWRGAPLASGEPLELAEEFLWGRKSRTVWWEEDMAVDGNYIRGNNKAVVWATEGKGIARESMSVWPSGGVGWQAAACWWLQPCVRGRPWS